MMDKNHYTLVGYASGIAGVDSHTGSAPDVIQKSPFLLDLEKQGLYFSWDSIVKQTDVNSLEKHKALHHLCLELARKVSVLTKKGIVFSVVGGDHSSAIGTWSGVYDALHEKGELGLIWIDAHMDSHTPETSESGRIHGMPLACLLGSGHKNLTTILQSSPKLKPENVCLIGVRSFEKGEADYLKAQKVRIFFMDEVNERGFQTVLSEAAAQVSRTTAAYGISIDIDALDPLEAPGVGVPEPDGIYSEDLLSGLAELASDPRLIATEIVEFDPGNDKNRMTEKLVVSMLEVIASGKRVKKTDDKT